MALSLPEFIARWQASKQNEQQGAQSHFIGLCDVLGEKKPGEADSGGEWYIFEKGVAKPDGRRGRADVWMRGHFAWEYKSKGKDLEEAYRQIAEYREDLENPPLLVVCDFDRFHVHTNFTGTAKRVYKFTLADLASGEPTPTSALPPLKVLHALFNDTDLLRPDRVAAQVTEQAAQEFALLADSLRKANADPEEAARFLMRLLFCLFAEDIRLLPPGLFTDLVNKTRTRPEVFNERLRQLFDAMATGGSWGSDDIRHFNGGLFTDDATLPLTAKDMDVLARAAKLDWSSIEPAIFGTLFERSLDPAKRTQLGAHYTSKEDILLIVEPVLMEPFRRQWAEVKRKAEELIAKRNDDHKALTALYVGVRRNIPESVYHKQLERLLADFLKQFGKIRVLDPACGSGNFLYVALKRLLDLEKEVINFAASNGVLGGFATVDPSQLYGIEINSYAHELASVVVWIGYIQWLNDNGFGIPDKPVLKQLNNIQRKDAILAFDDNGKPIEPEWPEVDVIIGNPPFLGGNRLRREMGDKYTEDVWQLYESRVPSASDLVCYWFEKARAKIINFPMTRAGLLATQGIRGGANRVVLERISQSGGIFWAQSDRNWLLDGANVHVSMIGFDNGTEHIKYLDGLKVPSINSDLTATMDITQARFLRENDGIAFKGTTKMGPFEISENLAQIMLSDKGNPNGRPNSDVIKPTVNANDLTNGSRNKWVIDFGVDSSLDEAALYEQPFEYVRKNVLPVRMGNRRSAYAERWWIHAEARPGMRKALYGKTRYICTPVTSKHRPFIWLDSSILPDQALIVFARDDDYFFGALHSRMHELWVRRIGTQLREVESGQRYTPTSTFGTYPFPWPPGHEPKDDPRVEAIAQAAHELAAKRDAWLNPEGAPEADLKKLTLTNLYNARPTWLELAHKKLDRAVLDAYGWPHTISEDEILERLLALNLERAGKQGRAGPTPVPEADTDDD